jgi:putative transposase
LPNLPSVPYQKRRLHSKYWRRERNRTNQFLHVVSKRIAGIADKERVTVAFENIKNIRQSMRSKRRSGNGNTLRKDLRRRLNQWPFRKLQFFVEYKVERKGLPTVEASNYRKSRLCPICGHYNRPKGHAYRCEACGFEASRHLVASWNIAKDGARHVPADCWQMKPRVERLVAVEKPSVKPERIPLQFANGILGR